MHINIPQNANTIIHTLQKAGHKAYVVGGCVRDSLLNKPVNDWDITTSATPDEIMKIFAGHNIIETGLKHGTVTIMKSKNPYEVTTFRQDGSYSDGRHPDNVTFTNSLLEDLKRRDFTINAMAYNDEEGLIDPFEGQKDLKNKLIRCVGSPDERFSEDILRILRAIRFSARYNFQIESETEKSLRTHIHNINTISAERIKKELFSIAGAECFPNIARNYSDLFVEIIPELKCCVGFNQNNPYHLYDVWEHTLKTLENCKNEDLTLRFALLFHDIGKPYCMTMGDDGFNHFKGHGKISSELSENILRRLKFTNEMRENITELIFYHDTTFEETESCIKRWLNRIGEPQVRRLLQLRRCDILGQADINKTDRLRKVSNLETILDDVLAKQLCFSLKDLAINGKDLINIGFKPGKELGATLNDILEKVINSELSNDKENLLTYIKKLRARNMDDLER